MYWLSGVGAMMMLFGMTYSPSSERLSSWLKIAQ